MRNCRIRLQYGFETNNIGLETSLNRLRNDLETTLKRLRTGSEPKVPDLHLSQGELVRTPITMAESPIRQYFMDNRNHHTKIFVSNLAYGSKRPYTCITKIFVNK